MVANLRGSESGQGMIETLLVLPLIVGLFVLTMRVFSTIQISIVNQKYVRRHALALAGNSAVYPMAEHRRSKHQTEGRKTNVMVLGMTDFVPGIGSDPEDGASEQIVPKPQVMRIARARSGDASGSNPSAEPEETSLIRVRTTLGLCVPSAVIAAKAGKEALHAKTLREGIKGQDFLYCQGNLEGMGGGT